jgi:hypothetical protein
MLVELTAIGEKKVISLKSEGVPDLMGAVMEEIVSVELTVYHVLARTDKNPTTRFTSILLTQKSRCPLNPNVIDDKEI